jgi:micrococcal nuclease
LTNYFYFTNSVNITNSIPRETAIIARVIDGDTIVLSDNRTLRFLNINAPEKSSILATFAYNFLKQYENKKIEFEITNKDIYNRSLAKIYSPSYLNLLLVKEGFASKFLVQKDELKAFDSAERQAIEEEKGIWKKSPYFICMNVSLFPKWDLVYLKNLCSSINLSGWLIKDESRKTLSLPPIVLGELVIHSSKGVSNSTDLFWNSSTSVWNDNRDTFYLFDDRNRIAAHYSYGY